MRGMIDYLMPSSGLPTGGIIGSRLPYSVDDGRKGELTRVMPIHLTLPRLARAYAAIACFALSICMFPVGSLP